MLRRRIMTGVAAGVVIAGAVVGVLISRGGGAPTTPAVRGWLGSVDASYAQSAGADLKLPSRFSGANLLVAIVANDGPDSVPVGTATSETSAVFSGTSGLTWTRHAHISAHQDWAAPNDRLETYGASSAEIWTATPPANWSPSGDVREISSHPSSGDDGGVVTIVAYSNGQLGDITTLDGLDTRTESQAMSVPNGSAVYAALFNGRVNANFTPGAGYHTAISRNAGDDTAKVIASNDRALPASLQRVGYVGGPAPGDYWEGAVVVVTPLH
ncbi:MAG TPA: hypothetical protein VG476_05125 [Acidimicrobiales bacterium]|nr:hypothetical protein [Acidimicrobiales bacterium]